MDRTGRLGLRRPALHLLVIALVVLVCTMLVGLDGWRTWQDRAQQIGEDNTETANLARSLAQHAHDVIQAADTAVVAVRDAVETDGLTPRTAPRLNRLMASQVAVLPVIHGLYAFDADGSYVASDQWATPRPLNGSDRAYFQYHREHADRGMLFGNPVRSKLDGSWIVTVSRRLDAADGRFAGVVLATISVDFLQAFYATFDTGAHGAITLVSADGIVLARKPADGAVVGADVSKGQIFSTFLPRSATGSFAYTSVIDGIRRIGSYRRVQGYPMVMIVGHSLAEVLAPWRANAVFHLWVSLGAAGVLAWVGSRLAQQARGRQRAEVAVRDSERHYRLLAENSTDLITQLGPDLRRVYSSPASAALLGYSPQEMAGRPPGALIPDEDWPAFSTGLAAGGGTATALYRTRRRDGSAIWVETTGRRMGGGEGYVLATRDVTQRRLAEELLREANAKLERMVMLDGLTGIANRRCFELSLEKEHRRAVRSGAALGLLMIDVDHFKAFNDLYGHPAGDGCLREIAGCIAQTMQRPADLTARYGGEEFAVLLPETEPDGAAALAERVRAAVRGLGVAHAGNAAQVATVSIGLAVIWPKLDARSARDLVTAADVALYEAKAAGRDRVGGGMTAPAFPVLTRG